MTLGKWPLCPRLSSLRHSLKVGCSHRFPRMAVRTERVQATDWRLTGCGHHPAQGLLLCSASQTGPARGSVGLFPSLPPSLKRPRMCPETLLPPGWRTSSPLGPLLPTCPDTCCCLAHPAVWRLPEAPTGSHTLSPLLLRPPQGTALVPQWPQKHLAAAAPILSPYEAGTVAPSCLHSAL